MARQEIMAEIVSINARGRPAGAGTATLDRSIDQVLNQVSGTTGSSGTPDQARELLEWLGIDNPPPAGGQGGRGGRGGGRERGGFGPEGPRGPLPPEYLWSPEFRAERWQVANVLMNIEGLLYEEKYDGGENEQNLEFGYKEWKRLESLEDDKSYKTEPFTEANFERPSMAEAREAYSDKDKEAVEQLTKDLKDKGFSSVEAVFKKYNDLLESAIPVDKDKAKEREDEIEEASKLLSRCFEIAHKAGFLDGVDGSLDSVAKEVQQGLDQNLAQDEVLNGIPESWARGIEGKTGVNKRITAIKEIAGEAFKEALNNHPEIAILKDVGEVYINRAKTKLMSPCNPGIELRSIEQEYLFSAEREGTLKALLDEGEIYWRPQYANYFTVYARTKDQFDRAKETFIRWARSGFGKDPQELFSTVDGFRKALTIAGQRGGTKMQEYTVKVRHELEGLVGVIEAGFFAEQYKHAEFQKSWDFVAQYEGPTRMIQLAMTSQGIMAAVLHKFAKDPRLELLFSSHGSRGQLMGREANEVEMLHLQKQILAILTAEVLGIRMKHYNIDDQEKILDEEMYRRNLAEVLKFKPDEYLVELYEGFDLEAQDKLYQELEANPVIQKIKLAMLVEAKQVSAESLTAEQKDFYDKWKGGEGLKLLRKQEQNLKLAKWIAAQEAKGVPVELTKKELGIYNSYKEGTLARPMIALSQLQSWERLGRARRIQQLLAAGKDSDVLEGDDKVMYDEAKNAVDVAYELFGAMGEKAERGGGVFLVDRVDAKGESFRDYIPVDRAEKLLHFAENWTKATYGGELDEETLAKILAEDPSRPDRKAVLANELKYRVDQNRRFNLWGMKVYGYQTKLWDFTLLRNGKPVDPNTLGYSKYGINTGASDPIERYRYAVPDNPRILGYNSQGKEVILVFDENGKPLEGAATGLEFDPKTGQVLIFDRPAAIQTQDNRGKEITVKPKLIVFDNLNKNTRASRMLLKTPIGEIDPKTHEFKVTGVEKKPVDFQTAIRHLYSRFTTHLYWGYQEEDKGLVLTEKSFAWAKLIKAGRVRWEDAPPHAVQLLMIDPTLERVGRFDLQNLPCIVNLTAVEESYQAHWRIGDELYLNFFPEDASREKIRTEYILQDHGGSTKEWFHFRAEAAYWPDMKTRRLRTFIPYIPLHFASMSKMWGAPGGALDVFRMMAYQTYRMVGQFAFEKWVAQIAGAQDVYESMADWYNPQKKKIEEGLGRKLNNEADNLKKFYEQVFVNKMFQRGTLATREDTYQQFLQAARESLNRMEVVENRNTVLESFLRGDRGGLWMEGQEIYQRNPDGSYIYERKPDGSDRLDKNGNKIKLLSPQVDWNRDSGSSRHSNKLFHYRYARLIRSKVGYDLYPDTFMYYVVLDNSLADYPRLAREAAEFTGKSPKEVTGWDWLEGKMNN